MKLKRMLITSLLGGAMLALPMTLPAFAQSSYGADSGHIQKVDWWWDHYKGDRDGYANHGWHRDTTNMAVSGMPATAPAVSRTRCGKIGPKDILPRLTM